MFLVGSGAWGGAEAVGEGEEGGGPEADEDAEAFGVRGVAALVEEPDADGGGDGEEAGDEAEGAELAEELGGHGCFLGWGVRNSPALWNGRRAVVELMSAAGRSGLSQSLRPGVVRRGTYLGWMTVSMMWMTPLSQAMSALVTVAPSMWTEPFLTSIAAD